MIAYRPVLPLSLGKSNSWKSVLSAVVMAALLGTAAFGTAAEAAPEAGAEAAVQLTSAAANPGSGEGAG